MITTKNNLKFVGPAAVFVLAFAGGTAGAAISITFDERSFEGGVDGSAFNTSIYNINSPTAVVEDDGSAQSPYTSGGVENVGGQTKGLLLSNQSGTDAPATGADLNDVNSSTTYYLQFDYKGIDIENNPGIYLQGSGGRAINFHMNSTVQVNQGSGFSSIIGLDLSEGAWYRFTLTINPLSASDDTFDLRVQSLESTALDETAAGLGFQNDTTTLNDFRFHFNTAGSTIGGQYAIDNVRWTTNAGDLDFDVIPEPSSLGLLGLGALCLLRRQRI